LRAAELGIEAAAKRAGLARFEIYALTGILDANGAGSTFERGPGLEVPIPIFHQNQGGIALAKARLEKAARQYVTVRDRILPPLEQSVGQAEKAYLGGDVSFLFVLETTRKLAEARVN
jgi:outer membrane protein TolC